MLLSGPSLYLSCSTHNSPLSSASLVLSSSDSSSNSLPHPLSPHVTSADPALVFPVDKPTKNPNYISKHSTGPVCEATHAGKFQVGSISLSSRERSPNISDMNSNNPGEIIAEEEALRRTGTVSFNFT